MRMRNVAALGLLSGLALAGCGGGSSGSRSAAGRSEGTIRMAMANVGSLDPARATTTEETELDWVLYTGLLTYRHARGEAGTTLIPGVAASLPQVSDGGRLYAFTLRRGLRFWNGRPLRATDVVSTIERTMRIKNSAIRPLLVSVLAGASAFDAGRARSISGVTGEDASGRVTIRLRHRDRAFDSLLAEPALGIVPAGTPPRNRPHHPPLGIGPYRLRQLRPGRSFTLARNPYWAGLPGIPAGRVDIDVTLSHGASMNALAVLNDVLDVEDPAEPISRPTLDEIRRLGTGRESSVQVGRPTAYVFLDAHAAPFNDPLAREGVIEGLGAQSLASAGARTLSAVCDVVPVVSDGSTPDGCPTPTLLGGELASAQALVARSGTTGEPVTVWAPQTGPERDWLQSEAAVLRTIGFAAHVMTIPDARYRSEIAALVPHPAPDKSRQPGRRSASVRQLLTHHGPESSPPVQTVSADAIVDGRVASTVKVPDAGALAVAVGPVTTLAHGRLDDQVVLAEQVVPELMSWRMNESTAVIDPIEGLDLSSLQLR